MRHQRWPYYLVVALGHVLLGVMIAISTMGAPNLQDWWQSPLRRQHDRRRRNNHVVSAVEHHQQHPPIVDGLSVACKPLVAPGARSSLTATARLVCSSNSPRALPASVCSRPLVSAIRQPDGTSSSTLTCSGISSGCLKNSMHYQPPDESPTVPWRSSPNLRVLCAGMLTKAEYTLRPSGPSRAS